MPCRCAHRDMFMVDMPFSAAIWQGAAVHDVLGVEPVAVDLLMRPGSTPPGVDSVSVGKMGDCLAVDVVARGDVTQGHTLLVVVGNQNLRR